MIGFFGGLEIAKRGLMVHRQQLNIANHNIGNANTPGYSRQTGVQETAYVIRTPVGTIGTGVEINRVQRTRDLFLDNQFRKEQQGLGEWESREALFDQLELIFNEPGETGIDSALSTFRSALNDLSVNPQNPAVRASVLQAGESLSGLIRHVHRQLTDLHQEVQLQTSIAVDEVNVYANEIAELNDQISKLVSTGRNANELMDRRDHIIDKLSGLIDVVTHKQNNGAINLTVGGQELVTGGTANELAVQTGAAGLEVVWQSSGTPASIGSGKVAGLLDMGNRVVPGYIQELNKLAESLADGINSIHRTGYGLDGSTGNDFFTWDTSGDAAATIQVVPGLDASQVAASSVLDEEGNGDVALAMASLMDEAAVDGTATYQEHFASVIARLGIDSRHAKSMVSNQKNLVGGLENLRASVSGVSLDEEMAQIIQYQHAFNASSRVITVIDEMLRTLIERTGV